MPRPRREATQKSLTKYDKTSPSLVSWLSGKKDVTFPYDYGPNRGCPSPITPLTTTKATIDTAIAAMTPHAATGTFVPTGLVWGWHVLSKGEPFTEGVGPSDADYDETIKAVVLMSDGDNSPTVRINNNHNQSTYSGYNYTTTPIPPATNKYRLQATNVTTPPTDAQAVANLNAKTAALCANVKSNGTTATDDDIRLYTITFGTLSTTSTDLMRNCASTDEEGTKLYFHAPNSQQLGDIFDAIGEDLNKIHLSM